METIIYAGIREISLVSIMPGLAQEKILDSLRLFAAEVMPRYTNPAEPILQQANQVEVSQGTGHFVRPKEGAPTSRR
jgi:hypothetical protein